MPRRLDVCRSLAALLIVLLSAATALAQGGLKPAPGEICLEGVVRTVDAARGECVLEADHYTLPSGKSATLKPPRAKTVKIDAGTAWESGDANATRSIWERIRPGIRIAVCGPDGGTGTVLLARRIVQLDGSTTVPAQAAKPPEIASNASPTVPAQPATPPETAPKSSTVPAAQPATPPETAPPSSTVVPAQSVNRPELVLQTGHTQEVTSVAFSPDGRQLATSSRDNTMKLWEVQTGALLRTLGGPAWGVTSVAFSPDGRLLASSGGAGTLLWDVQTGALLRSLDGRYGDRSVAFSPDGRQLASTDSISITIRDVQTGALLRTLNGHTQVVDSVAFSPDGRQLASGSDDKTIKLWEVQSGALLRTLVGHTSHVWSVAFSPDGRQLASGSDDKTVKLWEVRTGELLSTLNGHAGHVNSVAFSPDGRQLATASYDDTIKLWDVHTGALLRTVLGNGGHVKSVVFSPDGRLLASGGMAPVRLWEVQTGALLRTLVGHTSHVWSVAFSPDGRQLAYGTADNTIKLWEVQTGALLRTLIGHTWSVQSVAFSPDGRQLATGSGDRTIKLWEVQTGALVRTLSGHTEAVTSVVFSPDGRQLATGSFDHTIKLWEAQTGALRRTLNGHSDMVLSVAFSPDGRLLASGSRDKTTKLWDVQTGVSLRTISGHAGSVLTVAFSPDGRELASVGGDNTIKLWDVQTGALLRTLIRTSGSSVVFSPGGGQLATGSYYESMLWDVQSGTLLRIVRAIAVDTRGATLTVFSPDGRRLASGSLDGTIKLWDAGTGQTRVTFLSLPEVADEASSAKGLIALGDKGPITLGDKDVSAGGGEWFALTPEGWFDCSANAARFIKWNINNKLYPAERYYRRFRRPDLVRQSLRGEKVPAADFTTEDVAPALHFVGLKYDGPAREGSVTVTLEAQSRHEIKGRDVTVLVNGRPLPPELALPVEERAIISPAETVVMPINLPGRGDISLGDKTITLGDKGVVLGDTAPTGKAVAAHIDLGDKPIDLGDKPVAGSANAADTRYTMTKRMTFRVPLPPGAPEVKLRAIAYDSVSLGSNWAEMIPLSRPNVKPIAGNLYVLCVGIGKYKNADGKNLKNLRFSPRDAADMATRLEKEGRPLYKHVEVFHLPNDDNPLLDDRATLTNIRAGLKWLQDKARPGAQTDTVVVFLSGHGFSDAQGRYYFPTHNFDLKNPKSTSLSGEELQTELGGKLRARDVFLFVDSCHSGALSGARSDDLSFDISTSGVYMMASSGSAQSSYEYEGWGHGAFTLALLNTLKRPELAQQGSIRFNVLTYAVPDEISKLMRAAQQNPNAQEPVIPLEGRRLDEPVAQPG